MALTNENFNRCNGAIRPTITYTIAQLWSDGSKIGRGLPACAGSASISIRRQIRASGVPAGEFKFVHPNSYGRLLVRTCRFLQFTAPAISWIMGG